MITLKEFLVIFCLWLFVYTIVSRICNAVEQRGFCKVYESGYRSKKPDKDAGSVMNNLEWIPVDERLPIACVDTPFSNHRAVSYEVLVTLQTISKGKTTYSVTTDSIKVLDNGEQHWCAHDGWRDEASGMSEEIIAWAPLPEPYKEG